jgi:hypothetical protein
MYRRADDCGMRATRTNCQDCGFEVVPCAECPLCGHRLARPDPPTSALRTLFGD